MEAVKSSWLRGRLAVLPQILVFDLKAFYWPALLVPFVAWALMAMGACRFLPKNTLVHLQWMDFWDFTAGVWVTGVAGGLALLRFIIQRKWYWLWLGILAGLLFCREIHFAGSNIMAYVGIVVVITAAWLWYERMADYFTTRHVVTLIVLLFMFYAITQTLDQRWWKFLPYEDDWTKATEEFLEVLGHGMLLGLAVFSRPRKKPQDAKPAIPAFLRG